MFTYKATNTLNGKFYIGSTRDFQKRKEQHLKSQVNYPFQNALRKNPDAFEWEVVEDDVDSPTLEQALLDMWFGTEMCYNLNPCASRPPEAPESLPDYWVEAIKESRKGYSGNSPEAYARGWETRRANGKDKPTSETRSKMRDAHTGKTHSPESRDKRSQKLKGRTSSAKGSKWYINESTGETKMFHEPPGEGWQQGRRL